MLIHYMNKLCPNGIPKFEEKYLFSSSLIRLKKIGYFCGMDYASKDVYKFSEYISRFSHSMSSSFQTFNLTNDETQTIATLCHDVATPCFSHVIDYMNKDYAKQETTEEYLENLIEVDGHLRECLKKDSIKIDDIINFKKYSVVDTDRPKLCADRLDGIVLTGIGWTKNLTIEDIDAIVENMKIYPNEFGEQEIGFSDQKTAKKVYEISESIDKMCHSSEDNYMMELLASIVRYTIEKEYITYYDLYLYTEPELLKYFDSLNDTRLNELLHEFRNIKKEDIPTTIIPDLKSRSINPLVNGKRLIKHF